MLGADMPKLAAEAAEAITRLRQANVAAREFAQALEPVVLDYCVGLAREPYHAHRWCEDPA